MADQWFIARDKKKFGPYSTGQMKQLATKGQLLPSDMIMQEGMAKWVPASQVKGLFDAPTSPVPPPLPPAVVSEPAEWHFTHNGQQAGPVTWPQLKQRASSGQLQPTDMVWKARMPAWVAASSINDLFPKGNAALPVPSEAIQPTGLISDMRSPLPTTLPPGKSEATTPQTVTFTDLWQRFYTNKPLFFITGFSLVPFFFCIGGVSSLYAKSGDWFMIFHVMAFVLLGIMGVLVRLQFDVWVKHTGLHGVWEPEDQGISFEFRDDGTVIRGDGNISKFRWIEKDQIEFYGGDSDPVKLHVVKLERGPLAGEWATGELVLKTGTKVLRLTMHSENKRRQRREMLCGLWEPVSGEGLWCQFSEDGGMLRSDGFAAKYRWCRKDQEIELFEDGVADLVRFTVITLSKQELVLKCGNEAGHFRKGESITDEARRRQREATLETLKTIGKGVATVAGTAAAVLAIGGLAVLCGVAGVAGVGSSEGGVSGRGGSSGGSSEGGYKKQQHQCTGCHGKGWFDIGSRTGERRCNMCGGQGVVWY